MNEGDARVLIYISSWVLLLILATRMSTFKEIWEPTPAARERIRLVTGLAT